MKLTYTVKNGRPIDIDLSWFQPECAQEDHEIDTAVCDCASDYHSNHGGSESRWPMEFALFMDGKEIGRTTVDREFEPEFICS